MPAAASATDVCNLALDDLKQLPIKSVDTPVSATEQICARNYDTIRRECLFAHPWKFAITRIQLAANTVAPPFGYLYAYDLPSDYIRMITVGDDYLGNLDQHFEIENNQLLASRGDDTFDGSTKDVRYMRDVVDVTKFSPGFVTYFRLKLAIRLSNKFNVPASLKAGIKEDFREAETEARAVNGQESKIKRIQYSRVLNKRRGIQSDVFASKFTIFDS